MRIDKNKIVPVMGILGWEKKSNDTLAQLDSLPGNIAHPDTFSFPVVYKEVSGACYQSIVVKPDNDVLQEMIKAARLLEKEGVKAIVGNCGFDSLFQNQLAQSVNIPVFTSSLLLVPMVSRFWGMSSKIGIITADKPYLTKQHLNAVGITDDIHVCIYGIEQTSEFNKIRSNPHATVDVAKFEQQVLTVVQKMLGENPMVRAIVLECTDLPPFASAIRNAFGLPVFDITTLAYMVFEAVSGNRWPDSQNLNLLE